MLAKQEGLTLIELIVVIAIVGILASAALPLSRMTVKRLRETELRGSLRVIRTAIDAFHRDCLPAVPGQVVPLPGQTVAQPAVKLSSEYCKADQDYYPESLELLTQPLRLAGSVDKTRKYLRRIPQDPMMPASSDASGNWGLRSYQDEPDSQDWGGGNVYDVYSKSEAVAIDGTKYNTW
jgi:general secretion pathway protein G